MMCKYKVTIAVMTYNRSRFLDLMLESIQNQTYRDFVVKVYDNGSTDETDYVVQKYLNDTRFKYIKNSINIGALRNFNIAIENCKSDFLLLTHDDDIMHTPGHTSGSVSVIIDDEIALVGDTMFGIFRSSVFPPFADNIPELIRSWKSLLETECSLFLPSHGREKTREELNTCLNEKKIV